MRTIPKNEKKEVCAVESYRGSQNILNSSSALKKYE